MLSVDKSLNRNAVMLILIKKQIHKPAIFFFSVKVSKERDMKRKNIVNLKTFLTFYALLH